MSESVLQIIILEASNYQPDPAGDVGAVALLEIIRMAALGMVGDEVETLAGIVSFGQAYVPEPDGDNGVQFVIAEIIRIAGG